MKRGRMEIYYLQVGIEGTSVHSKMITHPPSNKKMSFYNSDLPNIF